ncbi:hypothetical protein P3X46_028500 [Hevea brasiliensis]|uniref:ACT domain-containing protein ACR n=1 Tax=Hevea brasiliensis TaxID=3981 RepID=A0ABQ9KS65_HEVBR|nr:hypothetical protein P3X46_028500 [Hevea brasiliensis]
MAKVCWPYFDPEYENLSTGINPPRISVDNTSCNDCTLIKVDRMNKPGILLEVVQILTDIDLIITKAYISSDGGWFMDIFHVTDQQGKKIMDSKTIDYIEKLISRDRLGLLSEITAVLANLHFNVVAAEVWTHDRWIACVVYVNDDTTCRAVDDPTRLSVMKEHLKNILGGCEDDEKAAHTSFSLGFTHIDRRLHQLFLADRDCEGGGVANEVDHPPSFKPKITIERCGEKGYSVVSVRCKDRAKLLFDIVCTLTDMQYVVFHATISSDGPYALQGLSLELCAKDRVGLLSEVTRVLRENGLLVTRAGVTSVGEQAVLDMKTIEALQKEIGHTMMLNVKKPAATAREPEAKGWTKTSFFFGNLFEKFFA